MVETKAAEGYILDETAHEVVLRYEDEAPEIVTYTLELTNKPVVPETPDKPVETLTQTGDNFNPWIYVGAGLLATMAGIGLMLKKKRKPVA